LLRGHGEESSVALFCSQEVYNPGVVVGVRTYKLNLNN
jgi:hypothetical protein